MLDLPDRCHISMSLPLKSDLHGDEQEEAPGAGAGAWLAGTIPNAYYCRDAVEDIRRLHHAF